MNEIHILWVDDEIDLLKPHIIFLEKKGYSVTKCTNGADAIDIIDETAFDIIFLDENMPGISGLDTLTAVKSKQNHIPVVMITKNEEEYIMEDAIGNKIADYLIKPVNPNQILLSLKKILDHSRLISEKTTSNYQQEFGKISMDLAMVNSYDEWVDLYKKLVFWEIELEHINDTGMSEILESQKKEANSQFFKFVKKNYHSWMHDSDGPILSHHLFKTKVLPELSKKQSTLLVVVDNLRYDQFMILENSINKHYKKQEEISFASILPTATQYARNAIFSGLTPLEMEKKHPDYWKNDTEEGGKNLFEKDFLAAQLKRLNADFTWDYHKITNLKVGKQLVTNFNSAKNVDLTVIRIQKPTWRLLKS